jgi:hypothetical protein
MGCLDEAAPGSTHEITRLLQARGSGDEQLMPLVYDELHRLANKLEQHPLPRAEVAKFRKFCK